MSTEAQKRAQVRYDKTRAGPITVRLTAEEIARLDACRKPSESRGQALKRLAMESTSLLR